MVNKHTSLEDDTVEDDDSLDEDVEALEKFIEKKSSSSGSSIKNSSQSRERLEALLEERRLRKELEGFDFDDLDD